MAKRRISHDEELPFVALMDTMTNVVGVLIIVLVMIAISLASSVKKVLSDLPPVTVEQLQELLSKIAQATPKVDPKDVAAQIKKLEEQIKKLNEELKTLDVSMEALGIKSIDLETLNKQLEERKKQRDSKKTDLEKLFAELDVLKRRLDQTPIYVPPPATVVKLPNPRPLPEKAVLQRFIVANGRVTYLNDVEFMKSVVAEIKKNEKNFLFAGEIKDIFGETIMMTDKGKKVPKVFLDRNKVIAHFETRARMSTRDLKMELIGTPTNPRLSIKLTPTPEGGDSIETMNNPAAVFQRAMRKFQSDPNDVVWFYIYKDSLPTYLAARDIADTIKVPVGWNIHDTAFYQMQIQEFEFNYTPTKPAPPPPAGTVVIPKPKAGLD